MWASDPHVISEKQKARTIKETAIASVSREIMWTPPMPDEHQDILQWNHMNFSYNKNTVWQAYGMPLHPGAAKYYREKGYMK